MLTTRARPKTSRTSNIPDVSVMKGGSITSASSYSSDEEHGGDFICIEGTDKANNTSRITTTDFQDRLDALLNIVNKAKSTTSVPRFIRKVEDKTSKKSPNDVIWNAYATTNSDNRWSCQDSGYGTAMACIEGVKGGTGA